ncbi:phosphatidate cytidylyltransferase [Effusibacillus dendaii]|uniref:Phosphatidate cytidylyltransferase n=1 Tax=Effusibacillus dendaii TaxID=2743772 RepID=A0A7I8D5G2_9BACL|nr:phosphatidate cytidylyltransferase [Effusibacillus dendaii]BCJ85297.1 phosphatidate cytidylyltransferase [Effusibacillus dendaii]
MLYQRVLTGVIGGIIFLTIMYIGDYLFAGLISLLGLVAFTELLRMKQYRFFELPALTGFLMTLLWIHFGTGWLLQQPAMLLWIVYGFLFLTVAMKNRYTFRDMSYILVGTIYIGLSFHYVLRLRELPEGLLLLQFVLFTTWATDIGAYFVGRALKGPKIWSSISPNKTVSGTIGGLLAAGLIGVLFSFVLHSDVSLLNWVIVALIVSVAGQAGDFVESGLKRSMDVKDSGTILPGHGGMLDRFDSLLFAAPIAYHLLVSFRF